MSDGSREESLENFGQENGGQGALYDFLYPSKELLPDDKEMTIFDHLEELRQRLFVSVLAVGAAILGCFAFSKELIMVLEAPVKTQGVRFLQLAPGEFFFTTLKVRLNRNIFFLGFKTYFIFESLYPWFLKPTHPLRTRMSMFSVIYIVYSLSLVLKKEELRIGWCCTIGLWVPTSVASSYFPNKVAGP